MKNRIKELRNSLNLTQNEFGEKIGCTRDAIAAYERGVTVKDAIIKLICIEFNVNEEWLRNGTGAMIKELTKEEEIASYFGKLLATDNNSFQKRFIIALSKMDDDGWSVIENLIDNITKDNQNNDK